MKLELTESEIEQIKESLYYHFECADDQTLHDENCRIIAKIETLQNTSSNTAYTKCPICKGTRFIFEGVMNIKKVCPNCNGEGHFA